MSTMLRRQLLIWTGENEGVFDRPHECGFVLEPILRPIINEYFLNRIGGVGRQIVIIRVCVSPYKMSIFCHVWLT